MQDFDDFIQAHGLTYTLPVVGDGSTEVDGIDVSWSWSSDDWELLRQYPEDRVWTVVDGDGHDDESESGLFVVQGLHYVNRMFYLVLDQANPTQQEVFAW